MSQVHWGIIGSVFLAATACGDSQHGGGESDVGEIVLRIAEAPTDVHCLVVTAVSSSRAVARAIEVVPGQAFSGRLPGLPTGSVQLGGAAFSEACPLVTPSSVATWLTDPAQQTLTIQRGRPAAWNVVLRPNGVLVPTVDWQDDLGQGGSGSGQENTGGQGQGESSGGQENTGGQGQGGASGGVITGGQGQGGSDGGMTTGGQGVTGGGGTTVQEYLDSLQAWPAPPAAGETTTGLGSVEKELEYLQGGDAGTARVQYICTQVQHDVSKNFDEVLNLEQSQSALKPGIVLQGGALRQGILKTIPLRRAPVTLSINLPLTVTTAVVQSPTIATLQQGVANLQISAGNIGGDLPALVSYSRTEVESMNELAIAVGLHGSYDALVGSANLDAAFSNTTTQRKTTVVAKLIQPMYMISVSDDEFPMAHDFFAPDLTVQELQDQAALGNIGPDNQPVFLSSVTYGRMVIFTLTGTHGESETDITVALNASYAKFSAGAEFAEGQKTLLGQLETRVFTMGGNSADVSQAIVTGDYNLLFNNPDATSAVPLTYEVKVLTGTRPVAVVGDVRQYVTEQCTPKTNQGWVELPSNPVGAFFTDVAANDKDKAFALGNAPADAGSATTIYEFDGDRFQPLPSFGSGHDVSVDDEGWVYYLPNPRGQLSQVYMRGPGSSTWQEVWTGGAMFYTVDAVGAGFLLGLGGDNNPYTAQRGVSGWTKRLGSATFRDCSLVHTTSAWCVGGAFNTGANPAYVLYLDGTPRVGPLCGNQPINDIAVSGGEGWAIDDVMRLVRTLPPYSAWADPGIPALPNAETPKALDAATGNRLWVVTVSGKLYRYRP